MEAEIREVLEVELSAARDTVNAMYASSGFRESIQNASQATFNVLSSGGKILLVGNGGSAADAQHIAAEFVNYFNFKRPGLAAIALTTDTSVLTSISNDDDFNRVFARQLQALGRRGDILFAYSTSGNSANVVEAVHEAKKAGIFVVGFTGSKEGTLDSMCDVLVKTPSLNTAHIQEGHLIAGHLISGIVESLIFSGKI